ncbi:MAG: sulfatase [Polyangiaceae bacterium]|nr:sulfatase [Polyangiaceae bacterium]
MRTQALLFVAVSSLAAGCSTSSPPAAPPPAASSPAPSPPVVSAPAAPAAPVASVAPAASAAPAPAAPSPMNVIVISVDSMRADMPWAGYPRDIAPRLTALQKKAVTYTNAYSISSFTSKSVGGFLAGRYPSELKRTASFFTKYHDDNVMFAEALSQQKIHTLGGHAHAFFGKGESGFEQGFETWRIVPGISFDYNKDPFITSQKMTPMAIEMLSDKRLETERFFAWFHYMDPHDVYQPHKEAPDFGGKKARDLYDQEMWYTDHWIGKLLDWVDAQPWAKRTAIVVTADHGEAFGEHKLHRHAFELYEVLVHVPLFFVVPGAEPRVIDAPKSHIDLVPTIFELMGADKNPELRGKGFSKELFGATPEARDVICDLPEDSHNERRRSLRHGDWKIIALANDFRYELYDLKSDPGEKEDLFKKNKDKAKEMVELYKAASATIKDVPIKGGVPKRK